MTGLLEKIKTFLRLGKTSKKAPLEQEELYKEPEKKIVEIHSIWDFLKTNENTQALHLISVIRFDEWATMEEIRQRIFELFHIDYKNERSLYPYLKTMVDLGLMEINNIGGKRKWRKKDLLIKIERKKKSEGEEEAAEKIAAT
ncbi:MAG: hypothetical protein WC308_03680 [archaeon]|jgi:hypothetical protein